MKAPLSKNLIGTREASELSGYNPDHIARIVRTGEVAGTRVGRSWLIDRDSLLEFMGKNGRREIPLAGLISTRDAGKEFGYSADYLAKLARSGEIAGTQVGRTWLVERRSLEAFLKDQVERKEARTRALARAREEEYRARHADTYGAPAAELPNIEAPKAALRTKPPVVSPISPEIRMREAARRSKSFALVIAVLTVTFGIAAQASFLSGVAGKAGSIVSEAASGFRSAFGTLPHFALRASMPKAPATSTLATFPAMQPVALPKVAVSVPKTKIATSTIAYPSPALLASHGRTLASDTVWALSHPANMAHLIADAFVSFGNGVIAFGHAAVSAEVGLSYRLAAAGPESAKTTVTVLGTTGTTLAETTAKLPYAARDTFLSLTALPAYFGPGLASSVFDTEYQAALAFNAGMTSFASSATHLAASAVTSGVSLGYQSVPTLASFSNLPGALQDAYLGALGKSAVTLSSFTANHTPQLADVVATTGSALSLGQQAALATYETVQSIINTTSDALAYLIGPPPTVVLPTIPVRPQVAVQAAATSTPAIVLPKPIAPTITYSTPTYNTTYVTGVSQAYVDQSLASLKSNLLATISSLTAPIAASTVTNQTTIQQVNMIQSLTGLTIHNGTFYDSLFQGGNISGAVSVNANSAGFGTLSAGTTNLGTTTVTGINVVTGSITSYTSAIAPFFTATSTLATSTFAGSVAVDGNGFVYATSTRNVGIGVLSPAALLAIQNSTSTQPIFTASSAAGSEMYRITDSGFVGIGTTSPWAQLSVNPNGVPGPAFAVGSSTATAFVVANSGFVGIGSSTPTDLLSIQNNSGSNEYVRIANAEPNSGTLRLGAAFGSPGIAAVENGKSLVLSAGNFGGMINFVASPSAGGYNTVGTFFASTSERGLSLSPNGGITDGQFAPSTVTLMASDHLGNGNVVGNNLSIRAGSGTGNALGGDIFFSTAPAGSSGTQTNSTVERARITASGNFGIGTSSPYSVLSISNTANTAANVPLFTIASTSGGMSTSTLLTVSSAGNLALNPVLSNGAVPGVTIFGNYTNPSNNEQLDIGQISGDRFQIWTTHVGSGSARTLQIDSASNLLLSTNVGGVRLNIDNANVNVADNLIFNTDNAFDIGASGGNRARNLYLAGTITAAGTATSSFAGALGIGTTSPSQLLSVAGSGYLTGGLGVGIATTSPGALQTTGDVSVGGNLFVNGNSTVIGKSTTNTLAINSSVDSNIIPSQNVTYDLGSPSFYWRNIYAGTVTANNLSAASTSIAGTNSKTFSIDSGNATADADSQSLIFFRGTVVPNATLTWNALGNMKRFELNQATYISNASASTTEPTFTLQSTAGQTADIFDVASSSGTNLFNITAGGNVGIGATSPAATLQVTRNASTNLGNLGDLSLRSALLVRGSTNLVGYLGIGENNNGEVIQSSNLSFSAGNNLLLNPFGGNVGIGTTSPSDILHVRNDGSSSNGITIEKYNNGAAGQLTFDRAGASGTAVPTGQNLGGIAFNAYTGTAYVPGGSISVGTRNTPGASSVQSLMLFTTYTDGAGSNGTFGFKDNKLDVQSNGGYYFNTDTNVGGNFNPDTAILRNAAGVLEVDNGTAGQLRDLTLRSASTTGQTVLATGGGNVGIGTTSPSAKLGIDNGVTSTNEDGLFVLASPSGAYSLLHGYTGFTDGQGGNLVTIANATSNKFTINSGGSVGITSNQMNGYSISPAALEVSGAVIRLGNMGGGTISNAMGIKFYDSGVQHMSMQYVPGGNFYLCMSSSNGNSLSCDATSTAFQVNVASGNFSTGGTASLGTTTITNLAVTNTSTSTFAGGLTVAGSAGFVMDGVSHILGVNTSDFSDNLNGSLGPGSIFASGGLRLGGQYIRTAGSAITFWPLRDNSRLTLDVNTASLFYNTTGGNPIFKVGSSDGAGQLALYAGNAEALRITSGGNVGIGTTVPSAMFQVSSTSSGSLVARFQGGSGGAVDQIDFQNVAGIGNHIVLVGQKIAGGTDSTGAAVDIRNTYGNSNYAGVTVGTNDLSFITTSPTTAATRLTIKGGSGSDSGNVGIGTTSPSQPLSVSGTSYFASNVGIGTNNPGVYMLNVQAAGVGQSPFLVKENGGSSGSFAVSFNSQDAPFASLNLNPAGSQIAYFNMGDASGNKILQLGQTFTSGINLSASSSLQIGIDSNGLGSGVFEVVKGNSWNGRAGVDGVSLFKILNSGNVGIGTTSPGALLAVQGNGLFAGTVTANNITATGTMNFGTTTMTNLSVTNTSSSTFAGSVSVGTATQGATLYATQKGYLGYPLIVENEAGPYGFGSIHGSNALQLTKVGGGVNEFVVNSADNSDTILGFNGAGWRGSLTAKGDYNWYVDPNSAFGTGHLYLNETSTGNVLIANGGGHVGIATTTPWAQFSINPSGITGPAFAIGSSTATNFVVTNSGNVGIGTAAPTSLLDIKGTNNSTFIRTLDAGGFSDVTVSTVGQAGSLNVGYAGGANNYVALGGGSFGGSAAMSIGNAGTVQVQLSGSGTNYINSGNVGIGTTTPSANLVVNGTTGQNLFQIATSTNQSILTVDTNGVASLSNRLIMYSNNPSGLPSSTDGGYTFNTGTFTSGSFTEVSGQVLSYGIDVGQIGARNTSSVGGIFRFDTRNSGFAAGGQSFVVYGYPTGSTLASSRLIVSLQNGTTALAPSGGNVGIGTTSPASALAVSGGATVGADYNVAAPTNGLLVEGNVGIGTTSPYGTLSVIGNSPNIAVFQDSYTGGRSSSIQIGDSFGQVYRPFTISSNYSSGGVSFIADRDLTGWGFNFIKNDGTTNLMHIDTGSGNVGIGTTTPAHLLEVGNGLATPRQVGYDGAYINPNATASQMTLADNNGVQEGFMTSGGLGYLGTWSNTALRFRTGNADRMTLDTSGNLGIGTTTPSGMLAVAGNVFANNIIPNGPYTNNLSAYALGNTGARWSSVWTGTLNVGTSTFSLGADSNSNLGFYTAASQSGTQAMTVTGSGHVLVGTATDINQGNLYVVGGARIEGTFKTINLTEYVGGAGIQSDGALAWRYLGNVSFNDPNNANVMTLATGAVGVGTANPLATFDVSNNLNTQYATTTVLVHGIGDGNFMLTTRKGETTNNTGDIFAKLSLGYQSQENASINFHRGGGTTGGFLSFATNNGAERMRIDGSGNVGIGTTSPAALLAVAGNGYFTTGLGVGGNTVGHNNAKVEVYGANGDIQLIPQTYHDTSGTAIVSTDATQTIAPFEIAASRTVLGMNGNVGIGTTDTTLGGSTVSKLTIIQNGGATGLAIATSTTGKSFALNPNAAGGWTMYDGGANGTSWTAGLSQLGGSVGVGTSSPAATLNVNGSFAVGAPYLGTAYGWGLEVNNASNSYAETIVHAQATQVGIYANPQSGARTGLLGISYPANSEGMIGQSAYPLVLGSNATEVMRLAASGKVGIGTTSPQSALTVSYSGSGLTSPGLWVEGTGSQNAAIAISNAAQGRESYWLSTSQNAGNDFVIYDQQANATRLEILSNGNVGIGSTNPGANLDVMGAANGNVFVVRDSTSGDAGLVVKPKAAGLAVEVQGTNQQLTSVAPLALNPEGANVGVGTTSPGSPLTVQGTTNWGVAEVVGGSANGESSIGFRSPNVAKGTTGDWVLGTNVSTIPTGAFSLYAGGNGSILTALTGGNVGIGTTTPATKLDVFTNTTAGDITLGTWSGSTNYNGIYLNGMSATSGAYNILSGYNDENLYINRPTGMGIHFRENNGDQMILATGGNLGIGSGNTTSRLDVTSADNTAATNIASFFALNRTQAVGIGYQDIRQQAAGVQLNVNAGTTGVLYLGNTSSGGVNIAAGGGGVTITGAVNGQTISSAASFTGTLSAGTSITTTNYLVNAGNGDGLCFWNDCTNYKVSMGNSAEYDYGPVTDYSIKTTMSNTAGRGWVWGTPGATPVAALGINGQMQLSGALTVKSGTSGAFIETTDYVGGSTGSEMNLSAGASTGNTYMAVSSLYNGGTTWGTLVLQGGGGQVDIGGTATPRAMLDVNDNIAGQMALYAVAGNSAAVLPSILNANGSSALAMTANMSSGQGEFDIVNTNIGAAGSGGFWFNQMTASNTWITQAMMDKSGEFGIRALVAATANSLCYNGSVTSLPGMNGIGSCSSDQRLKQNITSLSGAAALSQIMELNPVSFNWNPSFSSDQQEQFGLIAQQVEKVWPNLVSTTSPTALTPDGTLSLNFNGLYGPIIASIQEMNRRTDWMQATTSATTTVPLPIMTVDESTGNIGIGTTTPNHTLTVAGDVGAIAFVNTSTKSLKTDISYVDASTTEDMYNQLLKLKVATYRYKIEDQNDPLRLGFIAEDAAQIAPEVLSPDQKGVDLYKLATFTLSGVQTLAAKVDAQQTEIESLADRVSKLESGAVTIASSGPSLSTTTVVDALQSFTGVLHLGKLAANVFYAAQGFIDHLTAGNLTVGTPTAASGVTLYDTVTKQPYCFTVSNGMGTTTPGACGDAGTNLSPFPSTTTSTTTTSTTVTSTTSSLSITLAGSNPVYLPVGGTYVEAGAIVSGGSDGIDPYQIYVNGGGAATSSPWLDTSAPTTYILSYVARDSAGDMVSATRSVIVGNPDGTVTTSSSSTTSSSTTSTASTATTTTSTSTTGTAATTSPTNTTASSTPTTTSTSTNTASSSPTTTATSTTAI